MQLLQPFLVQALDKTTDRAWTIYIDDAFMERTDNTISNMI